MSFGDPVKFIYKGASFDVPHQKTFYALQRMMRADPLKGEPALNMEALQGGDIFEAAMALHRVLTFAGADIKDPMEVVHEMQGDTGESLWQPLGELIAKLAPPEDFKVTKKKPMTKTRTSRKLEPQ